VKPCPRRPRLNRTNRAECDEFVNVYRQYLTGPVVSIHFVADCVYKRCRIFPASDGQQKFGRHNRWWQIPTNISYFCHRQIFLVSETRLTKRVRSFVRIVSRLYAERAVVRYAIRLRRHLLLADLLAPLGFRETTKKKRTRSDVTTFKECP